MDQDDWWYEWPGWKAVLKNSDKRVEKTTGGKKKKKPAMIFKDKTERYGNKPFNDEPHKKPPTYLKHFDSEEIVLPEPVIDERNTNQGT